MTHIFGFVLLVYIFNNRIHYKLPIRIIKPNSFNFNTRRRLSERP